MRLSAIAAALIASLFVVDFAVAGGVGLHPHKPVAGSAVMSRKSTFRGLTCKRRLKVSEQLYAKKCAGAFPSLKPSSDCSKMCAGRASSCVTDCNTCIDIKNTIVELKQECG